MTIPYFLFASISMLWKDPERAVLASHSSENDASHGPLKSLSLYHLFT